MKLLNRVNDMLPINQQYSNRKLLSSIIPTIKHITLNRLKPLKTNKGWR